MVELPVTTVRQYGCYMAGWVTLSSGVTYVRPKSRDRALLRMWAIDRYNLFCEWGGVLTFIFTVFF